MKILVLILSLLLLGCDNEGLDLQLTPLELGSFGEPFYGEWTGDGQGSVLLPELKCQNIKLQVEPIKNEKNSLLIKNIEMDCNMMGKFTIKNKQLKISDEKTIEEGLEVGLAAKHLFSKDGRWFTFKTELPLGEKGYLGLQFFNFKDEQVVHLDFSLNPDGSGRVLVSGLNKK